MTDKSSFLQHLEELRRRILFSLTAVLAASIGAYMFRSEILDFLISPLKHDLVFISPYEAFFVSLQVSILTGCLLASPFIIFQAWSFIASACNDRERRLILLYVPLSALFLLAGSLFAFKVVAPAGLKFLLGFGIPGVEPMISLSKYISFLALMLIAFGTTFQLPLVMRVLSSAGLIDVYQLKHSRRYAIVAILVVSAMLTPPDVFTQLALAIPIIILYEIGLLFASGKKRKVPKG